MFQRLTSNSHTERIPCSKHRTKASPCLLSEGYHDFSIFPERVIYTASGGIVHGFVVRHRKHIKVSDLYCVKKLSALYDGQASVFNLRLYKAQGFLAQGSLIDSTDKNGPDSVNIVKAKASCRE